MRRGTTLEAGTRDLATRQSSRINAFKQEFGGQVVKEWNLFRSGSAGGAVYLALREHHAPYEKVDEDEALASLPSRCAVASIIWLFHDVVDVEWFERCVDEISSARRGTSAPRIGE